ncbi:MAG: MBL fold metallo-hydrolase [Candidatus Aenigmarchaeota archaeon]|nr:MBL fold metallo-hydrolase [Candidatus Aenigmarchaeota archaeon]
MPEVKVLIEGYAKKTRKGWTASSTCTLIRDGKAIIIVDPGINRKMLMSRLRKAKIKPERVDYVLLTHYHPDHALNAALFPKAKLIDHSSVYDGDKGVDHNGTVPGTGIRIIPTPGHTRGHCSASVKTDKGTVVLSGDVFWFWDNENQSLDLERPDEFAGDIENLRASRRKLLQIADYIIPGHGGMMKVR